MIFVSLTTQRLTLQSENGTPNKSKKGRTRMGGGKTTPFSRVMLAATVACAVLCIIAFFLPLTVVSLYDSFPADGSVTARAVDLAHGWMLLDFEIAHPIFYVLCLLPLFTLPGVAMAMRFTRGAGEMWVLICFALECMVLLLLRHLFDAWVTALRAYLYFSVGYYVMFCFALLGTLFAFAALLCRAVQSGKQAVRTQTEKDVLGDTFNNPTIYKKTDTGAESNVPDREELSDEEKISDETYTKME
ncbi:MAG: hypothetical protein KHW87_01490 [Clostridiales bacterium]|nr:hypothetical protein [Clostridiales bacterium]